MPSRAATPSTAALTRRQIREAERRAEQGALRDAAARVAATLTGSHLVTVPLDGTTATVGRHRAATAPQQAATPAPRAAADTTPTGVPAVPTAERTSTAPAATPHLSRAERRASERAAAAAR